MSVSQPLVPDSDIILLLKAEAGLPWKVAPSETSVGLGNVQAVPLAPASKADPQAGRTICAVGDSDLLTEMKRPDRSLFPWLSGQ